MQLLSLLLPVLGLVSFVAYVWLVVVAFKQSALWGVLVLLLSPISAIIFAIKYWQESKKPFLIYAGSAAGSVAIVVVMFGALGGFAMMSMASRMSEGDVSDEDVAQLIEDQMDRMENSGLLDAEEKQDLDQMRDRLHELREEAGGSVEQPSHVEMPAIPVTGRETTASFESATSALPFGTYAAPAEPEVEEIPTGAIPPRDAGILLGQMVVVLEKGGKVHQGTLLDVKPDELVVQRDLTHGTLSYAVTRTDVESITAVSAY